MVLLKSHLRGFGVSLSGALAPGPTLAPTVKTGQIRPFLAGVLTSVANPYFWLWWATLGGALLAGALALGPGDEGRYLAGHGTADMAWLLLVGAGEARGSTFQPDRAYWLLLGACGIALVAIGVAYTATAF